MHMSERARVVGCMRTRVYASARMFVLNVAGTGQSRAGYSPNIHELERWLLRGERRVLDVDGGRRVDMTQAFELAVADATKVG